jgi:hypothetical protein
MEGYRWAISSHLTVSIPLCGRKRQIMESRSGHLTGRPYNGALPALSRWSRDTQIARIASNKSITEHGFRSRAVSNQHEKRCPTMSASKAYGKLSNQQSSTH